MKPETRKASLRCVIYTRVSSDSGLEQEFNSLDNQREAAEAYVKSQAHEGWRLIRDRYDDGGFSGGSMERPGLLRLMEEVRRGAIDVIVVYKVDRLTRSLADFAKLVELFDAHKVSFVSVTQAFNTTTSMGRLTLNVLLLFAQFEREVTGERIRDKIAASKKKGIWMGGLVPLGYRVENRALHIVEEHAVLVREISRRYITCGSVASAYAKARVWLDRLVDHPEASLRDLADQDQRTVRSIRQTLSLAFLDPALANAALTGRLPRGFGLKRLTDLPSLWAEQWIALGVQAPFRR